MNRSQLSGARSRLITGGALALLFCSQVCAQAIPPQARYSTHDQTLPAAGEGGDFPEWGADVKSPGDGFTYSMFTIRVRDTLLAPLFSGASAVPTFPLFGFSLAAPNSRQVVLLQITDASQVIKNPVPATPPTPGQFYFYGTTALTGADSLRATNARGISVWPAPLPADTRIAICGETYDREIPLSQVGSTGWPAHSVTKSSGFIAVYNGAGALLWTHQFFGTSPDGSCAITDVSIRVSSVSNPTTDVVTYCGISSHGNGATIGTPLEPRAPFPAPAAIPACASPAGGATDNGLGQWDGFVGQLSHHASTGTLTNFHSVVGGIEQDGLFGIAEIDTTRFVVVGSTGRSAFTPTGTGGASFPLTTGVCLSSAGGSYSMGVRMVFDSSTVGSSGFLTLESSQELGSIVGSPPIPENRFTVARDVLVQQGYLAGRAQIIVVGSTDDPGLLASFVPLSASPGPQLLINGTGVGGPADGFILSAWDAPGFPPTLGACTFRGGVGDDGLTGINGWNEFTDQFVVTGFVPTASGNIDVASYYQDTGSGLTTPFTELTGGPATAPPGPMGVRVGGSGLDFPTAMGATNATTTGPLFERYSLGDPAGGGIAVDHTGRVNVVGSTVSGDYPVTPASPPRFPFGAGRPKTGLANDAVRTVLDMMPASVAAGPPPVVVAGVGRTDGTGIPAPTLGGPAFPIAPFAGGTSPECAVTPFGWQIGAAAPALSRMLVDYEGPVPTGGVPMALVVVRPPTTSPVQLVALDVGFPAPGGGPIVLTGNALLWTSATASTVVHLGTGTTLRLPLTLPPGPATFTLQLVCFHATAIPGGALGPPPCPSPVGSSISASPAMWLSY